MHHSLRHYTRNEITTQFGQIQTWLTDHRFVCSVNDTSSMSSLHTLLACAVDYSVPCRELLVTQDLDAFLPSWPAWGHQCGDALNSELSARDPALIRHTANTQLQVRNQQQPKGFNEIISEGFLSVWLGVFHENQVSVVAPCEPALYHHVPHPSQPDCPTTVPWGSARFSTALLSPCPQRTLP